MIAANANLRRAQLALARGRTEDVTAALDRAEDLLADTLEPPHIALLAVLRSALATREGDLAAARAAVDRGIDRIQFCTEDGIRISQVAQAGIAVESEVAVRARDLGDAEEERA